MATGHVTGYGYSAITKWNSPLTRLS